MAADVPGSLSKSGATDAPSRSTDAEEPQTDADAAAFACEKRIADITSEMVSSVCSILFSFYIIIHFSFSNNLFLAF